MFALIQLTGKQFLNYSHLAPQLAIVDDEVSELHELKGAASHAVGTVSGNKI